VDEFSYNVPEYLHTEKILLNKTDICGPCTKLIGSIDIIEPESLVIVLDDDIVMRPNFIASLYESYLLNPDKVTTHWITPSFNNKYFEIAGFAGFIFKVELLRDIKKFYYTMPPVCRFIDDNWISWCIKELGVEVVQTIEKYAWNKVLDIPNTDPHPNWFELCKNTDRQRLIREMFQIMG
jgi:hypothetical protein